MAGYEPLYIRKPETGLVQSRPEFILPDDAYPILENVYVWRERIKRRQGLDLVGRLRRVLTAQSLGNSGASPWTFTIYSTLVPPITGEPNAQIVPGSVVITIAAGPDIIFTDQGNGTLTSPTGGNSGVINYATGVVTLTHTAGAGVATTINFNYYPGLPVMGLRSRELNSINIEQLVAFDTKYAYIFIGGLWQEFIAGTTWTGTDSDFFWSTNYWVGDLNLKIFWVTNFYKSGILGDPIRYTNGVQWINFSPTINAAGDVLAQCLALLPFRGRLVAFNTLEGPNLANSVSFPNRIRWAAIGTPFSTASAIVTAVNPNAWRDDIRGQGGFLDIPTSESIVAVGFVRDNLVIYCERSTWQLRYTGRSIAPFQIEKVNSELGSESTFSAVQFDTSLIGIGDKGIVECDSYKSERIDVKIPDLVFEFKNENEGTKRVHGIRDFQQRLAYWTYVYNPSETPNQKFPNRRLVYNYENDSWAIFTDSLTTLGTFQEAVSRTWLNADSTWDQANFPWLDVPAQFPYVVGGNQQGYVLKLSSNLSPKTTNDVTLFITNITGNTTTPTIITSPNHNLVTGQVVTIHNLLANDPFYSNLNSPKTGTITGATQAFPCEITSANHGLLTGSLVSISGVTGMVELNGLSYTITTTGVNTFTLDGVDSTNFTAYAGAGTWTYTNAFAVVIDPSNDPLNKFQLWKYSPSTLDFTIPQTDVPATYLGNGQIAVRDGFSIVSKKFNFLEQGQNIQLGYIDVLMDTTKSGAITLNVYLDYNNSSPVNVLPENINPATSLPDPFFNTTVNTFQEHGISSIKNNQRVFCSVWGHFITLQWTLSNAQLISIEQESDVQIDYQILWIRQAGSQLNTI